MYNNCKAATKVLLTMLCWLILDQGYHLQKISMKQNSSNLLTAIGSPKIWVNMPRIVM